MRHGGDLDEASRLYGEPTGGWLDLSTGVNPRPYPTDGLSGAALGLARLPSPSDLAALIGVARESYGVPDGMAITAAPGTEILIRSLPKLIDGPVSVLDTSYRSYRESFGPNGRFFQEPDLEALMRQAGHSVLVVNPNNPDGRVLGTMELVKLARSREAGRLLIVDESYAESEPGASLVPRLRRDDPVLVLKSFGKFFGLPGLRLGFAIGPEALISQLAAQLGDWPVSGAAIAIGRRALADGTWQSETRHWMGNQAQALDGILRAAKLALAGGCRLFRIANAPDSLSVHEKLARQGIWTRIFDDRPGLIRFGLPPDTAGLQRLGEALRQS